MPLITAEQPSSWERLEELVAAILSECGMVAQRGVCLTLPRGSVDVDVLAEESVEGIVYRTICECKNWRNNIPKEIVHAFRTVMQETGAHRGYIISKTGFQTGATEAAKATNIELVTFEQFQITYFGKWLAKRRWTIEEENKGFPTYYEPIGLPGYSILKNDQERAAYDRVWRKYFFAGMMLIPFSPYVNMVGSYPPPPLPFNVSNIEKQGFVVPNDVKNATGYRELLAMLEGYAKQGLAELREVNPITRGRPPELVERED